MVNNNFKYAGFNIRMLAAFVDAILSTAIIMPCMYFVIKIYGYSELQTKVANGELKLDALPNHPQFIEFIIRSLVYFSFQTFIFSTFILFFWIFFSSSPGKMLFRMKIIDEPTGNTPSKKQFFLRYISYLLSFLPMGLGFIWIFYSKKNQGFHDKIARTAVIYKK